VPFAYLRDPLFLACFAVYFAHRWLARSGLSPDWLRFYLNDVICLPFWVPMMLWAARVLRLRNHDGVPRPTELVIPLVLWAAVLEVILPATPAWSGRAFADPYDVLCYAAGGLVSLWVWNWWYAAPRTRTA
jgi:hypothetical protein